MLDANQDNNLKTEPKNNERNSILLVGIGIFAWIGIGSVAFFFKRALNDIFLNIGISPSHTVLAVSLLDFTICIIGIVILIKIIKSGKYSDWNIFISTLLLLIIGQALQFIEPILNNKFKTEEYFNNSSQYYDFLMENQEYYYISAAGTFLIWIIVALIIYKKT